MGSVRGLTSKETSTLKVLAAKFNYVLCNSEDDIFGDSLFSALILADPAYPNMVFLKFLANDAMGNFQNYKYIYNLSDGDFCSLDNKSYRAVGKDKGLRRLLIAFYDVFSGIMMAIPKYDGSLNFISVDLGLNISNGASYKSCEIFKSTKVVSEWNLYIKAHSDTYKDLMQLATARKVMGNELDQYLARTGDDG